MATPAVAPIYSHGGTGSLAFPVIPGTGVSNGQPVSLAGATQDAAFTLIVSGTTGQTMTVQIQANGGIVDALGHPPDAEWIDVSGGGYVMTVGSSNVADFRCKTIPRAKPYYRTAIIAYTSGTLISYCDGVIGPAAMMQSAQRPAVASGFQQTT